MDGQPEPVMVDFLGEKSQGSMKFRPHDGKNELTTEDWEIQNECRWLLNTH